MKDYTTNDGGKDLTALISPIQLHRQAALDSWILQEAQILADYFEPSLLHSNLI